MRWFDYLLAAALGISGAIALTHCVKAEELTEIDTKNAAYCAIYSRETVFIDIMHGKQMTADTDVILGHAKDAYAQCLSILPALLPLDPDKGSLKSWLADIRDIIILKAGTKPATEGDLDGPKQGDEEWRAQCRAEYTTWEEETGTVVRRGNPERVRCPCGDAVVCG